MKLKVLSTQGSEKKTVDLPAVFSESIRKDIIKRAVDAIEANNRQPYGAKEDAGMRASAKLSRRRHNYRGSYGYGISRVPRKITSRRGTRFNWVAAVAPGTVGGRRAHPPKPEKIYDKKVNAKENRLAIRSALAASMDKEMVLGRGHKAPDNYPFAVDAEVEKIAKTKELISVLKKLGLDKELERTDSRKVRAGKGKARGRRYNIKRGVLIVTAEKAPVMKAVSNVLGFECVSVSNLNTKLLAPGGVPGRIVLFTDSALDKIGSEKLFTEERVKKEQPKKEKAEVKKVKTTAKKEEVKQAPVAKPEAKPKIQTTSSQKEKGTA